MSPWLQRRDLRDNDLETVSLRTATVGPCQNLATAANRKRLASGMIEQLVGVAAKADERDEQLGVGAGLYPERGGGEGHL